MDLQREFEEGMERLIAKRGHFVLNMDVGVLVLMIATIQLALRHPHNNGLTARQMRSLLDDIFTAISQDEPRLAEILRMGDDPEQDVPLVP